ncbi:MarR family winged helix-turn-helix transcriptional regulator [Arthrobacter globiformis]|uniref:MarR family winged helix-turn-helix transcriptional regulator n=1 Tax=Arthrobacter globiformis TaxID=1665 RepID=UPI001C0E9C8E|nr:MarR family transcriptional regulator [Arthrobacter globiformis]
MAPDVTEDDTASSPLRRRDRVEIWRSVMEVHAAVLQEIEKELQKNHGLTAREFDALVNIPDDGVKMKDLVHRILLSQSAVSRLIDRLQQRKLVTKAEVPGDSRVALLRLTDEGRIILRAAARSNATAVDRALSSRLNNTEMMTLGNLMDKIRND